MSDVKKVTPCANAHTLGCTENVVKRGNILCDSCIESRSSTAKDRKDLHSKISQLNTNLKSIQTEYDEKLFQRNQEILELRDSIDVLQTKNTQLMDDLHKLNTQYKSHIKNITDESARVTNLHELEMKNMEKRFIEEQRQLEIKNRLLQLKVDEISIVKGETDVQNTDLQTEKNRNKELTLENEQLSVTNESLKEEIKTLKKELELQKNKLDSIRSTKSNIVPTKTKKPKTSTQLSRGKSARFGEEKKSRLYQPTQSSIARTKTNTSSTKRKFKKKK